MRQPALNYQGPAAAVSSRGELKDGSRSWIARADRSRYGTATMAILISRPRQKTGLPIMAASPAPGSATPYVALPVSATCSASDPGGMGLPHRSVPPRVPFRSRDLRAPKPGVRATTNALKYATGAVVRNSGPSLSHARIGPPGGAGLASPPRASERRMPRLGRILSSRRSRRSPSFRRGRRTPPAASAPPPRTGRPGGKPSDQAGSRTAGGRVSRG